MKAIKIDAQKRECYYVEYTDDIKSIHELLDCTCFTGVGIAFPGKGDILYVDDNGAINGTSVGFRYRDYSHDLYGNGLICGTDLEGYSKDVVTDLEYVKSRVVFGVITFQ